MIVYNVTINIEDEIEQEWLNWMRLTHIPELINTGCFVSARMTKVLVEEQMGGKTYSIQYSCNTRADLDKYIDNYAPQLQSNFNKRYKDKFVAFRTIMQVIEDF
jgi:hypothetical protein